MTIPMMALMLVKWRFSGQGVLLENISRGNCDIDEDSNGVDVDIEFIL